MGLFDKLLGKTNPRDAFSMPDNPAGFINELAGPTSRDTAMTAPHADDNSI